MMPFIETISLLHKLLLKNKHISCASTFHLHIELNKSYIRYQDSLESYIDYEIPHVVGQNGYVNDYIPEYNFICFWTSPHNSRYFVEKIIDTIEFPNDLFKWHKMKILR